MSTLQVYAVHAFNQQPAMPGGFVPFVCFLPVASYTCMDKQKLMR